MATVPAWGSTAIPAITAMDGAIAATKTPAKAAPTGIRGSVHHHIDSRPRWNASTAARRRATSRSRPRDGAGPSCSIARASASSRGTPCSIRSRTAASRSAPIASRSAARAMDPMGVIRPSISRAGSICPASEASSAAR